jgi:hypothetical protein
MRWPTEGKDMTMPIAVMIQLAFQAASAAISLLKQLGYLKEDDYNQMMYLLMRGNPPEEKSR